MERLLTTKELAALLRLNEKKVYHLIREGGIPHVRIAGKWLFPKGHIERWLEERVQREQALQLVGSDDYLFTYLLSKYCSEQAPANLAFYAAVGSLRGLEAFAAGMGDGCCIHLLDPETGEYNIPFLARHLRGGKYIVVNLYHRNQGLIVQQGNPLGIKGLRDVTKKAVRFINRQKGSGTRVLLDHLLNAEGISPKEISFCPDEVSTHIEVAREVFRSKADVGLGIEYAAHLFSLDFIPLCEERFDLVISKLHWHSGVMKRFLSYLTPVAMRRLAPPLPGYHLRETGKVIFEG